MLLIFSACSRTDRHSHAARPVRKPIGLTKEPLKPVMGYRFVITGNFDGSGKTDTLTEHFISSIDHRETNKLYEGIDYDSLIALNQKKTPELVLYSSNKNIAPFKMDAGYQLGLAYLKNEGDLNGDGRDEISYVVNYTDWSNLNECVIATYKNKKWRTIYAFDIWDWQLPNLPGTYNDLGIAGRENFVPVKNDTVNQKILKNFNEFQGLIKKVAKNKMRIIYMKMDHENGPELDTTVVDIRKRRPNQ